MNFPPFQKQFTPGSFPGVQEWLTHAPEESIFTGLAGSADALLVCDLLRSTNRPILCVVESNKHAEIIIDECKSIVGENAALLLPSRDPVPYNQKSPFGPTVEARFTALKALIDGEKKIVATTPAALVQRVVPSRALFNRLIRLEVGQEMGPLQLGSWLSENGFRKEALCTDLGTYSIRGGLLDIYPFMVDMPIRLEFWGDTIESIRGFDVFSQKSKSPLSQVDIFPMKEFCLTEENIDTAIEALEEFAGEHPETTEGVHRLKHQWKEVGDLDGAEWYLTWFEVSTTTITDYLPQDTIIVYNDLIPFDQRCDENVENYRRHLERVPDIYKALVSPPEDLLANPQEVATDCSMFSRVYVNTSMDKSALTRYACSFSEQAAFPQVEFLINDFAMKNSEGYTCTIVVGNIGAAERLSELINEACPFVTISLGFLQHGFVDKANKIVTYSEHQLYQRHASSSPKNRKIKSGTPITSFDQLVAGDYVVHVDHGIARFVGVQRVDTAGIARDCMVLFFAEKSKLFVPVDDFHKVQKYIGKESFEPTLSRLGSGAWEKLKERTRESLKDMAQELIDLYAKREFLEGISFSPDTLWQKEFEDAFIYEETPDQLRAIAEVKADMENHKPMDRLVCGDVGFGKTEVAIRAAFKAVMDGYQVAVLAPTTILAVQHFNTFTERMANFPVKIGVLSRFQKPKEQKEVVEKVKNKEVDILIGTHRILSQDIVFKNLGMLIIDEEQKFGVRHKERLSQLKYKIDVLSMTATPIPRTLHMSLTGARDLSMITTPPRNRVPVETVVGEYRDEIVKSAIENELERGGQVYFVNNRIKGLDAIQDKIEQLVPQARVISGHGQMHEDELEMVMKEFIAGRYDVLLSTVIIENGLDISNVNTIIVNRADMLGLSQLYQLRGRVGRSAEQAYAYLLTPEEGRIDAQSLRRLQAMEQYTELGSGFQIAMRDLEIRGAGNLLGTRQHGFIAAVGFELYCQLLQEAVAEIKGETPKVSVAEVTVDIPIEALISTEYVSDAAARINLYQELSGMSTLEQIETMRQEFLDRFGPIPPTADNLLSLMQIRVQARDIGAAQIKTTNDGKLLIGFSGNGQEIEARLGSRIKESKRQFDVTIEDSVFIRTPLTARDPRDRVAEIFDILSELVNVPVVS